MICPLHFLLRNVWNKKMHYSHCFPNLLSNTSLVKFSLKQRRIGTESDTSASGLCYVHLSLHALHVGPRLSGKKLWDIFQTFSTVRIRVQFLGLREGVESRALRKRFVLDRNKVARDGKDCIPKSYVSCALHQILSWWSNQERLDRLRM
jgi:hypothetical protein